MVLFNRLLLAAALAFGFSSAAPAASLPSVQVFQGTVDFFLDPVDPGRVDAIVFPSLVVGHGGAFFEFSAAGEFALSPLGGDVTNFFLNIFAEDQTEVLVGGALLGAPMVSPGPEAAVLFSIVDGTILQRFKSTALLRLSGLDEGLGTVDIAVLLTPIPLPAAAPLLLAGLAGLALVRRRRA